MSKSQLRRLSVQIPQSEQPQFLAETFDVAILREALAIAERDLTTDAEERCLCMIEKDGEITRTYVNPRCPEHGHQEGSEVR